MARKDFVRYQLMEHLLLSFFAAAALPLVALWLFRRRIEEVIEMAEEQPWPLVGGFLVLIMIANVVLVTLRRNTFVVGLELEGDELVLHLRGLLRSSYRTVCVPLAELTWTVHRTQAIQPITNYRGYRFSRFSKPIGDLFIDHFIWEGHERRVKDVLAELHHVKPLFDRGVKVPVKD